MNCVSKYFKEYDDEDQKFVDEKKRKSLDGKRGYRDTKLEPDLKDARLSVEAMLKLDVNTELFEDELEINTHLEGDQLNKFVNSHNLEDNPEDGSVDTVETLRPDQLDDIIYSHPFEDELDRDFRLSQLGDQPDTITVEPLFNITPRPMPDSPHNIIEEEFRNNPWAMLVATIFLTKTTGLAARPFMKKFFTAFPSPIAVVESDPSDLETYFETLGMRKRGAMIWKMSYQFISAKWRRASDLYGIGKYGEDAYRLFCLGHADIDPTDRYLRLYLDWLKSKTDHIEEWGISDCEGLIEDPIAKYYAISLR